MHINTYMYVVMDSEDNLWLNLEHLRVEVRVWSTDSFHAEVYVVDQIEIHMYVTLHWTNFNQGLTLTRDMVEVLGLVTV